jgi:hypothetical protein
MSRFIRTHEDLGLLLRKPIALVLVSFCAALGQTPNSPALAKEYGTFTGTLQFEEGKDGVHKKILQAYTYTDPMGRTLTAPPGFETDGASIPRALWSIVGSPFTGKYVGAAVIHDVGCDTHKYSWQDTHRMFFTAMLALGVSEEYAKILYWGVRLGGPKWEPRVVEEDSVPQLEDKAKKLTGARVQTGEIHQVNHLTGKTTFRATIQVPIANTSSISDSDAQRIARYIRARQADAAGPISLDEIDERTPLGGELPQNAIPQ